MSKEYLKFFENEFLDPESDAGMAAYQKWISLEHKAKELCKRLGIELADKQAIHFMDGEGIIRFYETVSLEQLQKISSELNAKVSVTSSPSYRDVGEILLALN